MFEVVETYLIVNMMLVFASPDLKRTVTSNAKWDICALRRKKKKTTESGF